jgi:hypothetical protein
VINRDGRQVLDLLPGDAEPDAVLDPATAPMGIATSCGPIGALLGHLQPAELRQRAPRPDHPTAGPVRASRLSPDRELCQPGRMSYIKVLANTASASSWPSGVIATLDQPHSAPNVVNAVLYAALAAMVGVIGPDGLLSPVTKAMVERAQTEEMTAHLAMRSTTRLGAGPGTAATAARPRRC